MHIPKLHRATVGDVQRWEDLFLFTLSVTSVPLAEMPWSEILHSVIAVFTQQEEDLG